MEITYDFDEVPQGNVMGEYRNHYFPKSQAKLREMGSGKVQLLPDMKRLHNGGYGMTYPIMDEATGKPAIETADGIYMGRNKEKRGVYGKKPTTYCNEKHPEKEFAEIMAKSKAMMGKKAGGMSPKKR